MGESEAMEEINRLLHSKQRLERNKGISLIEELLSGPKDDAVTIALEGSVFDLLSLNTWESHHGALLVTGALLSAGVLSDDVCKAVQGVLPQLLDDQEPRLRLAAGNDKSMGQLLFSNVNLIPKF